MLDWRATYAGVSRLADTPSSTTADLVAEFEGALLGKLHGCNQPLVEVG